MLYTTVSTHIHVHAHTVDPVYTHVRACYTPWSLLTYILCMHTLWTVSACMLYTTVTHMCMLSHDMLNRLTLCLSMSVLGVQSSRMVMPRLQISHHGPSKSTCFLLLFTTSRFSRGESELVTTSCCKGGSKVKGQHNRKE